MLEGQLTTAFPKTSQYLLSGAFSALAIDPYQALRPSQTHGLLIASLWSLTLGVISLCIFRAKDIQIKDS